MEGLFSIDQLIHPHRPHLCRVPQDSRRSMIGFLLLKSVRDLSLFRRHCLILMVVCLHEVIDWAAAVAWGAGHGPASVGPGYLRGQRRASYRLVRQKLLHFFMVRRFEILESINCVGYSLVEHTARPIGSRGIYQQSMQCVCRCMREKRPARSQQRMNIDISSISFFSLFLMLSPPRRSRPHRCRRCRSSRLVACFDASIVGALCGSSQPPNHPCYSMCSCP